MKKRNVVEVELTENELKKIVKEHLVEKGISCKEDDVTFTCDIPTFGIGNMPKKAFLRCTVRGLEGYEEASETPLHCACSDIATGSVEM